MPLRPSDLHTRVSHVVSVYTETVRDALLELSDAEYQRRVWTGQGTATEMSSFDETIERLFDDSGLAGALERGDDVYGSKTDSDLRKLEGLVRVSGSDPDSKESLVRLESVTSARQGA